MEKETYTIKTVQDIYNLLTEDNIENFSIDMIEVFLQIVHIKKEVAKQGFDPLTAVLYKEITWTNDGIHKSTAEFIKKEE